MHWTWKEGLSFALAGEFRLENGSPLLYQMSSLEKWCSLFVKPFYKLIEKISKYIRKPIAICLVTVFAGLLSVFVFYNFSAIIIFGKLFPYQTVRFILFLYIEMTLLSMGCRAFARFNNRDLIDLWKNHKLTSVFPGDS